MNKVGVSPGFGRGIVVIVRRRRRAEGTAMPGVAGLRVTGRVRGRWAEALWAGALFAAVSAVVWGSARGGWGLPMAEQPAGEAPALTGPPGWALVVSTQGATPARQSKRHASSAAFTLREGQSLDPAIPGEGMAAAFAGTLAITEPGRYRLGLEAQGGSARLTAFDQRGGTRVGDAQGSGDGGSVWTAWAELRPGPVTISIQFTRTAGAARLRTWWERQGTVDQGGFPPEPIPASAVSAPKYVQRDVTAAESAFRGRVLMGELNCTGCHRAGPGAEAVLTARAAPMLGEIGATADGAWLRKWVADPQAMKPRCGMPDVVGDTERDRADAEAITHFLVSLGGPMREEPPLVDPGAVDNGRRLFHTVGCVACHGALEAAAQVFGESGSTAGPEAWPAQPFGNLAGKWRPGPLAEFLKDPLKTHPAGRMPSMLLDDGEARAIAAYLVKMWGPALESFAFDAGKVETGKAAFAARGCAACHQLGNRPAVASTLKVKPLAELAAGAGCLSPKDTGSPRFGLSERDRADLAAAVEVVKEVGGMAKPAPAPLDEGERLVAAFGCLSCHTKDERGGPSEAVKPFFRTLGDVELGDEGRLPPRLSGVGNKLKPAWLRAVLTDAGRARRYMSARMPQFGKLNVGRLHTMLVAMDGAPMEAESPGEPRGTDELLLAGRKLVGEKGMNCISCHAWDGKTAGTPGPDLTEATQRIRYDWWKTYVLAPARYKPGTRMTAFYAGGSGQVKDVFAGDPHRQTDAVWAYLATGKTAPAPEGLRAGEEMVLAIGDRPVVFRTFLKDAGSRGIAVGYPIGVHFAFDATAVRLVEAWEGEFVDAAAVWKGRGGQAYQVRGKTVWTAPSGPPLIIGAKPEAWPTATGSELGYHFGGYRIERDGTPVFLYAIDPGGGTGARVEVAERFVPRPRTGVLIARSFEVRGLVPGVSVWVNAGAGAKVMAADGTVLAERGGDGAWWGVAPDATGAVALTVEIGP